MRPVRDLLESLTIEHGNEPHDTCRSYRARFYQGLQVVVIHLFHHVPKVRPLAARDFEPRQVAEPVLRICQLVNLGPQ